MDKKAIIKALRDTAQSASNTAASTISGPVDLIALGLQKTGLPVPSNAIGGSEWMNQMGFTAPVENQYAKVVGDMIGMAPFMLPMKIPKVLDKVK